MKILLLFLTIIAGQANAETIQGRASVTDGDTLVIREYKIRLFGIDAVEGRQLCVLDEKQWRCGQAAANALDQWIGSLNVTCTVTGTDRYKRKIARCYLGDKDMQAWLVTQGWAVAYRQYSHQYVPYENNARQAKRGIWASQFENPADWRKANK